MQRRKSPASARAVIKNVSGIIQFFLDSRGESNPDGITPTGESSVVLLRDYLESVDGRGRTVPGAVKTSPVTRSAAHGAPWPLGNPLVCAAEQVESSQIPKHDPPMELDAVRELDPLALNVEISPFKRAFASGILLLTYASLRSKTKKPHGLPRPWACPRMGVAGSTEWVTPLIEFRVAHEKLNGSRPSFAFPCLNRRWGLEKAEPAAYSAIRRKLAMAFDGLNGPGGETYTLRPPGTCCQQRQRKCLLRLASSM